MPHISVIIPVYKVEPYLHRCVDSVLDQTFTDHEPILVDDGSPDSCGEICEEYATADSRVIVIHQKNGGLSCARNTGIDFSFACSDSEWISFIDSDDWVSSFYLSSLYDACMSEKSDMAVCGFQKTDGTNYDETDAVAYIVLSPKCLWFQNRVNATVAWGKLYKKSKWSKLRFPADKLHEDEYTTYLMLFDCKGIPYIGTSLYLYYQNPNGIMKSEWSPSRMDSINAIYQQTRFFIKMQDTQLASHTAGRLIQNIAKNLNESNAYLGEENSYKPFLKKKLRKYLRRFGKLAGYNIKENKWSYYMAYPFEMKVLDLYQHCVSVAKEQGLGAVLKTSRKKDNR